MKTVSLDDRTDWCFIGSQLALSQILRSRTRGGRGAVSDLRGSDAFFSFDAHPRFSVCFENIGTVKWISRTLA